MHFSADPLVNPTRLLEIEGVKIPFSPTMRYLGVTLDAQLTWEPHKNKILKNAKFNLIKLNQKFSKAWGPKPHISKWIYTGIVRPKLTYASMIWGHSLSIKRNCVLFDKINRLAMHMIIPVRKSISTSALEVISVSYTHLTLPTILLV